MNDIVILFLCMIIGMLLTGGGTPKWSAKEALSAGDRRTNGFSARKIRKREGRRGRQNRCYPAPSGPVSSRSLRGSVSGQSQAIETRGRPGDDGKRPPLPYQTPAAAISSIGRTLRRGDSPECSERTNLRANSPFPCYRVLIPCYRESVPRYTRINSLFRCTGNTSPRSRILLIYRRFCDRFSQRSGRFRKKFRVLSLLSRENACMRN